MTLTAAPCLSRYLPERWNLSATISLSEAPDFSSTVPRNLPCMSNTWAFPAITKDFTIAGRASKAELLLILDTIALEDRAASLEVGTPELLLPAEASELDSGFATPSGLMVSL